MRIGGGASISGAGGGGGSGSRSLGYQGSTNEAATGFLGGSDNSVSGRSKMGYINNGGGAPYQSEMVSFRKPSRLEALPGVGARNDRSRKKSGPSILNTMGTF